MTYDDMLAHLRALPEDRRKMLVVRSMPFGDIIEDDTRTVHIAAQPDPLWRDVAYDLCREAKPGPNLTRSV